MFYFISIIIFIFGLSFYIFGNQTISKDVKTSWSPKDIETLQDQYANFKSVGQLFLLIFSFILIYNIT